jgi:CBS domain containing-hemolysin-like protein
VQILLAAESESLPWWADVLGLLAIPFLIAMNGFFVAAEFALVKVRRTRIEELVSQKVPRARSVEAAINKLDRIIAATQLGITLASLMLGWFGENALEWVIRPIFQALTSPFDLLASHGVAGALALLAITYMHVVFGELIPKTVALHFPERMALFVAAPLNLFTRLTRPLIILMNGTAALIFRLFGYQGKIGEGGGHSIEELALIIEDTEEAGVLDAEQADLVQNVFALSDKTVRDCMVPVDKLMALELNTPGDKVLEVARRGAHTRMPVYEGTLDNIVGIVNTKDLFYLFSLQGLVVLQDAIYPPLFLPPEAPVSDALTLFKKARRPMALVRDENEKILGLITLEDVLEEIIGEIEDEHDRPAKKFALWRRRELPLPGPAKK